MEDYYDVWANAAFDGITQCLPDVTDIQSVMLGTLVELSVYAPQHTANGGSRMPDTLLWVLMHDPFCEVVWQRKDNAP